MDAFRVWIERAANREIRGDEAAKCSDTTLEHRAAGNKDSRGGIVANERSWSFRALSDAARYSSGLYSYSDPRLHQK